MTTADYLAQYGIAESSLSPEVKEGINEVLRSAAYSALEQFSKIMKAEAEKRGFGTGTPSSTAANDAARAALDEKRRIEEEEDRRRARNRQLIIAAAIVGGVLLLSVVGLVIYRRSKRNRQPKPQN